MRWRRTWEKKGCAASYKIIVEENTIPNEMVFSYSLILWRWEVVSPRANKF